MTDITQIPARLPEAYTRKANFTDDYINDPTKPVTPQKVDSEFNAIVRVLQDTQARAALIQRDDGALQNESVARETLKPEVFAQLEALEAAASDSASAAAASASAAAASAQAAADDAAATAADRLATAADAVATAADRVATADDRAAAQASADAAAASAQAAADDAAATAADRLATAADVLATAADRLATAADAAATAADRAVIEALSAQFRGTYYGALDTDPAADPLGNPPTPGDLYFNNTTSTLRLFDGAAWNLASVDPSTLGTAAAYNVGTASDQIPTNGDLGTASTYNVGVAANQIPTNGDLPNFGNVVTYNVGAAAGQVPRNQDLGSASQADIATLVQALAGTAGVLITAEQARALIGQDVPAASATDAGRVELATNEETQAGTDTTRAVTPAALASRTATTSRTGLVELATNAETQAGTDTSRAVTPAGLKSALDNLPAGFDPTRLTTIWSGSVTGTLTLASPLSQGFYYIGVGGYDVLIYVKDDASGASSAGFTYNVSSTIAVRSVQYSNVLGTVTVTHREYRGTGTSIAQSISSVIKVG